MRRNEQLHRSTVGVPANGAVAMHGKNVPVTLARHWGTRKAVSEAVNPKAGDADRTGLHSWSRQDLEVEARGILTNLG